MSDEAKETNRPVTKFVLNRSALERLIGDDETGEFEVEINQAALRWLSDRMVKPNIEGLVQQLESSIKDKVDEIVRNRVRHISSIARDHMGRLSVELNEPTIKALNEKARALVDQVAYYGKGELSERMVQQVEHRIHETKCEIDRNIRKLKEDLAGEPARLLDHIRGKVGTRQFEIWVSNALGRLLSAGADARDKAEAEDTGKDTEE